MKLLWCLLPWKSLKRVSEVMTHGMVKYGRDTWKDYTVEEQLDAAIRHLTAHLNGEITNSEDWGLNHLDHAACRVLMAAQILIEQQEKPQTTIYQIDKIETANGESTLHCTRVEDKHWKDALGDHHD